MGKAVDMLLLVLFGLPIFLLVPLYIALRLLGLDSNWGGFRGFEQTLIWALAVLLPIYIFRVAKRKMGKDQKN